MDHSETHWTQQALTLAERGTALASPNPLVGAVLVCDGKVVGEAFHTYEGRKHAEVLAIEQASEAFGPLRLLVNNASIFEIDAAQDFSLELYERQMQVNLRAPLLLSRDFAAALPASVDGAIVNILDQRVWRLTPRYFSYTLSKSALWAATRTMAQAYAPRIRVNAVGPGPVFANAALGEREFEMEARGVPLQRAADVSGVVDAVVYLSRAKSVTGQMIAVDSGQHLGWRTPDVGPE